MMPDMLDLVLFATVFDPAADLANTAPATDWGTMINESIRSLALAALAALLYVLRSSISMGIEKWATSREKNAETEADMKHVVQVRELGKWFDRQVHTVGSNILNEMKAELRAAMQDGVVDNEERAEIREKIVTYANKQLGSKGKEAAEKIYGVVADEFNDWIANHVEARIWPTVTGLLPGGTGPELGE